MELRKICADTEKKISARDLVREIYRKHVTTEDAEELADDAEFDNIMLEATVHGTDDMEGICSILYTALWEKEEISGLLKVYETSGLPTTSRPEVLEWAVKTYGSLAQTDMLLEEMSELTKALLKLRRAHDAESYGKAKENVYEEMADVIIMLTQLLMIMGGRNEVQKAIDEKVKRLNTRLEAAQQAGDTATQEVLQSAT